GAGGRGRVLIRSPCLPLPDIEGQAPGHGLVAQAAHSLPGGDALLQGQPEILPAQAQNAGTGTGGHRLVAGTLDAVVAAGGQRQLTAAPASRLFKQSHVQLPTGMQCHNAVLGLQLRPAVRVKHIGIHMAAAYPQLTPQLYALSVELRIALKAGQWLAGLPCQQPAQMALAGTPVQPVRCRLLPAMTDARGEMGDLLPFAAGNVTAQQVCSLPLCRRAGARQP